MNGEQQTIFSQSVVSSTSNQLRYTSAMKAEK
jgi:hypothetical protein